MEKTRIVRLESKNGEAHFIVQEYDFQSTPNREGYSKTEAMKATRKEAAKPLFLTRE